MVQPRLAHSSTRLRLRRLHAVYVSSRVSCLDSRSASACTIRVATCKSFPLVHLLARGSCTRAQAVAHEMDNEEEKRRHVVRGVISHLDDGHLFFSRFLFFPPVTPSSLHHLLHPSSMIGEKEEKNVHTDVNLYEDDRGCIQCTYATLREGENCYEDIMHFGVGVRWVELMDAELLRIHLPLTSFTQNCSLDNPTAPRAGQHFNRIVVTLPNVRNYRGSASDEQTTAEFFTAWSDDRQERICIAENTTGVVWQH